MLLGSLVAASILLAQTPVSLPAATADKSRPEPDCRQLASSVAEPGVTQLCQGQAAMRAGNEAATGSQEWRAYLTSAARLLSAASGRLRDLDLRIYALESLARMYGAEQTLLSARQLTPDDVEVYRALSSFYARRAVARMSPAVPQPDAEGYYRIGDFVSPPEQLTYVSAEYPIDAMNAGVEGAVMLEVKIDERGLVTSVVVLKSIPMLDAAAVKAARQWRSTPTVVDGRTVPTKIIAGVQFRRP
jgi:TonB family protein